MSSPTYLVKAAKINDALDILSVSYDGGKTSPLTSHHGLPQYRKLTGITSLTSSGITGESILDVLTSLLLGQYIKASV